MAIYKKALQLYKDHEMMHGGVKLMNVKWLCDNCVVAMCLAVTLHLKAEPVFNSNCLVVLWQDFGIISFVFKHFMCFFLFGTFFIFNDALFLHQRGLERLHNVDMWRRYHFCGDSDHDTFITSIEVTMMDKCTLS